jgi:hypothetical protein
MDKVSLELTRKIVGYLSPFHSISLSLTNNQGKRILEVDKGELIVAADVWDYKYEGTHLQISAGLKKILLDLNLSNYLVKINKGFFLDMNLDGFIIDKETLYYMCSGEMSGGVQGSSASIGGFSESVCWGLLNTKVYPEENAPKVFAFRRKF